MGKKPRRVRALHAVSERARTRALIEADEKERLPLPVNIDPPGATDEEVRRNFAALRFAQVDQELLAILTARFHRRFENPFVTELRALRTTQAAQDALAGRAGTP